MQYRISTGDFRNIVESINESLSNVEKGFSLYDVHKKALINLLEVLRSEGKVRGILQMPTGVGKTLIAIGLIMTLYRIGRLKGKDIVLYLTPRIILKGQVEERLNDFLENNPRFQSNAGLSYFRVERPQEDIVETLRFFFEIWGGERG